MQTTRKHVKETQLQDVDVQRWKSLMTVVLLVTLGMSKDTQVGGQYVKQTHARNYIEL